MASYNLVFKKSVAKDLRNIPNKDVKRILKCIESLRENPKAEGCIKLSNQERYKVNVSEGGREGRLGDRVRQGVYRIIYEIKDLELIVLVVKVAHRGEAYKIR